MTGRDVVSAALRKIGALAPGETLVASEASDGLSELNRMLATWSTDGLTIYAITEESPLTLTPGDSTVTLGASGDITTRPQKIEKALIRDGSTDYPVHILTLEEYARIADKTVQSTYPHSLYDDGGYPQRTIKLYPVPNAAHSLVLFTKRALTAIASLATEISFPPGYEDALVYNLAVRLAHEYGRPLDAVVLELASISYAGIKRSNHRPSYLQCDPAVAVRGAFDINTGDYRR